jgi:hypothetical protein
MTKSIDSSMGVARRGRMLLALAWGFVGLPLAWGVLETLKKSISLFR